MTPQERRLKIRFEKGGKHKEVIKVKTISRLKLLVALIITAIVSWYVFMAFNYALDRAFGIDEESIASRKREMYANASVPTAVHEDWTTNVIPVNSSETAEQDTSETAEPEISENEEDNYVSISESDINLIAKALLHEVGSNPAYYPGYNLDTIQKHMASVIWNRVNNPNYPNTVYEVLTQSGQFMDLSELEGIEPNEQTIENVKEVISGQFQSSALFEMSFYSSNYAAQEMESQVGSVYPIYSAYTSDGRYLLFAGSNVY